MKINLSALMNLISEKETQFSNLVYSIKKSVFNTTIQELNGTTNIMEDTKAEFCEELEEIEKLSKEISLLKGILYEKNNSLKLMDGRSIQTAIVENTNLRKLKNMYENLLTYRNSKRRETEVNNSYFVINEVNYNTDEIKSKVNDLELQIRNTDFEISKLNSEEFEIQL